MKEIDKMEETLVMMTHIEKRFPGVHALKDCRFSLLSGEVHALIGENGAGKSTMMKILTGVFQMDEGQIYYKGEPVTIKSPRDAQKLGISIIHQELNLCQDLTVAQNIFIGREPMKGIVVNDKKINAMAQALLDRMNVAIDPTTKVGELTIAKQQMVEIAKALSFNSEVLIMDEPTAALTESEIDELFRIILELKEKNVGIVYISHRMEELKKICQRVTVMRDGTYIDTKRMDEIEVSDIIHMMVGREIYESAKEYLATNEQDVVLEVKHLNQGRRIRDVSFELRKGEILGFAGLMGAGRTEVARAIFGADPYDSGEIFIHGEKVTIKSPQDAVAHGIGYLSEDRKHYGLVLGLDVETNTVLADMKNYLKPFGIVDTKKVKEKSEEMVEALKTKTPSVKQLVKNLSGGNQQKVVIAKWLTKDCDILIFDEPTRGIDVGAKSEIYKLLNDLAQQGKSIIMISSELPEILRMSHRVVVMCEGRLTGDMEIRGTTQQMIMKCATDRSA